MSNQPHRSSAPRTRLTAAERLPVVVQAAIGEFARVGFFGASTNAIAREAGVSQPYLFKLFPTKRALFIAAYAEVSKRLFDRMEAAVEAEPDDPTGAVERAYRDVLRERDHLLVILQAFAAGSDPEIAANVRSGQQELFREIVALHGGDTDTARRWYAEGLLETIGAAFSLEEFIPPY